MTPAARAALVTAHMAARKHAPRIANATLHAAHRETSDEGRLYQLQEAAAAARDVLGKIMTAQAALQAKERQR